MPITKKRIAEIEAIADADIDTSDIPEADEDFFRNAKQTKLSKLVTLMENGEWEKALALANKFHNLGDHKVAIQRGHEAYKNPKMYEQMDKNPLELTKAGIKALKERYGVHLRPLQTNQ